MVASAPPQATSSILSCSASLLVDVLSAPRVSQEAADRFTAREIALPCSVVKPADAAPRRLPSTHIRRIPRRRQTRLAHSLLLAFRILRLTAKRLPNLSRPLPLPSGIAQNLPRTIPLHRYLPPSRQLAPMSATLRAIASPIPGIALTSPLKTIAIYPLAPGSKRNPYNRQTSHGVSHR